MVSVFFSQKISGGRAPATEGPAKAEKEQVHVVVIECQFCCWCFHGWCADLSLPTVCLLMWTSGVVLALRCVQGSAGQLE